MPLFPQGTFCHILVRSPLTSRRASATIRKTDHGWKEINIMMRQFASYFFSYFYFFGFGANKVKVLFAANGDAPSLA